MTGDCSRGSYWKFRGRLISWTSWLAEHLRCKESVNRPRLITARRERITVSGCGCWRRWQVKGSAVVKARKNARGLSRRPSWKRKKHNRRPIRLSRPCCLSALWRSARAERQSALRQHGLLSLIGRLLCFFLFQLGLLLKPRAFFLALTTAEPLTCHLRQQPHPLTVMRSRRAVMSLGLFTDSLHLRCSASQLVHEMRRPRNFQ